MSLTDVSLLNRLLSGVLFILLFPVWIGALGLVILGL